MILHRLPHCTQQTNRSDINFLFSLTRKYFSIRHVPKVLTKRSNLVFTASFKDLLGAPCKPGMNFVSSFSSPLLFSTFVGVELFLSSLVRRLLYLWHSILHVFPSLVNLWRLAHFLPDATHSFTLRLGVRQPTAFDHGIYIQVNLPTLLDEFRKLHDLLTEGDKSNSLLVHVTHITWVKRR